MDVRRLLRFGCCYCEYLFSVAVHNTCSYHLAQQKSTPRLGKSRYHDHQNTVFQRLQNKIINFQQFPTKNPKSRGDDLSEASASSHFNFYTYFPILASRLAFAPSPGSLRELPFPPLTKHWQSQAGVPPNFCLLLPVKIMRIRWV
jgi:hypothetical protein